MMLDPRRTVLFVEERNEFEFVLYLVYFGVTHLIWVDAACETRTVYEPGSLNQLYAYMAAQIQHELEETE